MGNLPTLSHVPCSDKKELSKEPNTEPLVAALHSGGEAGETGSSTVNPALTMGAPRRDGDNTGQMTEMHYTGGYALEAGRVKSASPCSGCRTTKSEDIDNDLDETPYASTSVVFPEGQIEEAGSAVVSRDASTPPPTSSFTERQKKAQANESKPRHTNTEVEGRAAGQLRQSTKVDESKPRLTNTIFGSSSTEAGAPSTFANPSSRIAEFEETGNSSDETSQDPAFLPNAMPPSKEMNMLEKMRNEMDKIKEENRRFQDENRRLKSDLKFAHRQMTRWLMETGQAEQEQRATSSTSSTTKALKRSDSAIVAGKIMF